MYIFGIPRVCRITLCIWFPRYMTCLNLLEVKKHRAISGFSFDPIRAVYGFVSYLLSSAALTAYLVWLLVPQAYLEAAGLSEVFPQKYWAVAIPIYLGVRALHSSTVIIG